MEKRMSTLAEKFVFMNKTESILEIGFSVGKNVVLFGPGGHGKSEITMEFFKEKGISPFVVTMGTGMTTDRLFGGLDLTHFDTGGSGKIEYLVENSFMNHEYVIFEEMMDAPDFILEQLKDILSSGYFRNGTQIFPIKTKFIVCCTNRTREEFSKNMSLKALMERFPLELNVIWDTYNEITYFKLLVSKFGDKIDPIIPYLLQAYAEAGHVISPRIAVVAYDIYKKHGPDSLSFVAEFNKKPELIADTIKKYESTLKFRETSAEIQYLINELEQNSFSTKTKKDKFSLDVASLEAKGKMLKTLTVSDESMKLLTSLNKVVDEKLKTFKKKSDIASIVVDL